MPLPDDRTQRVSPRCANDTAETRSIVLLSQIFPSRSEFIVVLFEEWIDSFGFLRMKLYPVVLCERRVIHRVLYSTRVTRLPQATHSTTQDDPGTISQKGQKKATRRSD